MSGGLLHRFFKIDYSLSRKELPNFRVYSFKVFRFTTADFDISHFPEKEKENLSRFANNVTLAEIKLRDLRPERLGDASKID